MQEMGVKDEEEDIEFSFLCGRPNTSPISADEIFWNGQIKPLNLLFSPQHHHHYIPSSKTPRSAGRLPLKKLLSQEREWNSNSSIECGDEEVSPELYCAWRPKVKEEEGKSIHMRLSGCYDSKRWKLKDFLVVAKGRQRRGGEGDFGKKGRTLRVASQSC